MLVDVTALLASAHPNVVTEAFSVLDARPATTIVATAVPLASQAAFLAAMDVPPAGYPVAVDGTVAASSTGITAGVSADASTGGSATTAVTTTSTTTSTTATTLERVPASQLPKLTGVPLLQQLSLLGRSDLVAFASQHPGALTKLAANPPAAAEVSGWWTGVPSARQADLVVGVPTLIGNLEGVPYRLRDQANRTSLVRAENGIRAQLAGAGRAAAADLNRRLHMLEQVRTSLGSGTAGDGRQLVTLDPSGDGTASVVAGDVATADYVTYLVPGMFSSVDSELATWSDGASRIAADQRAWLQRLTPAGSPVPTAAVVAWFGYHAPTVADVASLAPAREAESALAAEIGGLRALRDGHEPYVTVIAHSYGSTAVLLALQDRRIQVDALAVVGSPGSPARSVADLGMLADRVWAGAADADPVSGTALFGPAPTSSSFGATPLGVGGGTDPLTGSTLAPAHLHTDYFAAGTEALRNLELIGIGRGDLVVR